MAERHDVAIKIISQQGTCAAGHKVGDEWIIRNNKTPEGICLAAFNAMLPNARTLMFGGVFPWAEDPETASAACPDSKNPVIFQLRRLPK